MDVYEVLEQVYEVLEQDSSGNTIRLSQFLALSDLVKWWGKEGPYATNVIIMKYSEEGIRTVFKRVEDEILANTLVLDNVIVIPPVES